MLASHAHNLLVSYHQLDAVIYIVPGAHNEFIIHSHRAIVLSTFPCPECEPS